MKSIAFLLAAVLLLVAGCQKAEEPAPTGDVSNQSAGKDSSHIVTITMTGSDTSSMAVSVGGAEAKTLTDIQLADVLKEAVAAAKDESVWVALKADPKIIFRDVANILEICSQAGIRRFTLDGRLTSLRTPGVPQAGPAIRIDLEQPDQGDWLRVCLAGSVETSTRVPGPPRPDQWPSASLIADPSTGGQSIEEAIRSLHSGLVQRRSSELGDSLAIVLQPWPRCQYQWILAAYDEAEKARFTDIRVVVFNPPTPGTNAPLPPAKTARGKFKPGGSPAILHTFPENPVPDVADNNLARLETLGVGGGGEKIGGFEGLGDGRGFFGTGPGVDEATGPNKIVYIVDRSAGTADALDFMKMELKRSIGELTDDKSFHVIFYSAGPPVENGPRRLVNATERNKEQVFQFINDVAAQGEADPTEAIKRAFAVQPEMIYLLVSGPLNRTAIGQVKALNAGGKVTVFTVGFLNKTGEEVLKQIADENNGQYKFVSDKDLVQLRK